MKYSIEPLDRRLLLSASTLQSNWTTVGGGPAHTSYVPGNSAIGQLNINQIWSAPGVFTASSWTQDPIALGQGRVYTTARSAYPDENVQALDPLTGKVLWRHSYNYSDGGLSSPTYYDGRVYVQWNQSGYSGASSYLYALDASDGHTIWSAPFSNGFQGYLAPSVDASGIWIMGGSGGSLYGFHFDGTQSVYVPLAGKAGDSPGWTPTLADGAVYTYAGTHVTKFSEAGTLLWTYALPADSYGTQGSGSGSACAVSGGSVYFNDGVALRALDAATGTLRWSVPGINPMGTPSVANGRVYVGNQSGYLAYSTDDGSLVQSFPMYRAVNKYQPDFSPIVMDDAILFPGDTVTAVAYPNGVLRGQFNGGGYLALDHDTIYLSTNDGTLSAYQLGASLRGTIFQDTNANGVRDAGETTTQESGAAVYLDLDGSHSYTTGDVLATNVDAGGNYSFNVSPGTYTVGLIPPDGATATTSVLQTVDVSYYPSLTTLAQPFGINVLRSVSGFAQRDYNGDRLPDNGVYSGRTIFADLNRNGLLDASEPSTVTDANGHYDLSLAAGTYVLAEVLPSGYVETGRTGGGDLTFANLGLVSVSAGNAAVYNFLSRPPQTLAVALYNDTNANGTRETGEPLNTAANVVYLDLNNNGVKDAGEPSVVSADGFASFAVDAGTYTARAIASEADRMFVASGVTVTVAANGITNTSLGLQYAQGATGTAFADNDGNGIANAGDGPYTGGGVSAYIDLNNNANYETGEPRALVAADGTYRFSNLAVGTYTVRLSVDTSLARKTFPATGGLSFTVAAGQTATIAPFGVQPLYALTVGAFIDANGDGIYGTSDDVVSGRTIYADANNNGVLDTGEKSVVSSYQPVYLFLPAGVVTLQEIVPNYYRETGRYVSRLVAGSNFVVNGQVRVPTDVIPNSTGTFYFGTQAVPTIIAYAFNDANGNGLQSTGEAAATAGGFIYIDLNSNGVFDSGVDLTGTAGQPGYTIFQPPAGTYTLRQSVTTGWKQSAPANNAGQTVTITDGSQPSSVTFARWQAPTKFKTLTIDDGTAQRSRIRTVTVALDGVVTAAGLRSASFLLTQLTGNPVQSYVASATSVVPGANGTTIITIGFTGAGMTNGSLSDGQYRLTINGSLITDVNGFTIDAANTGVRGSTRFAYFSRLSSDDNGDGIVNFNDFLLLQNAFGTTRGGAGYVDGYDGDGNGVIDFNDFLSLQNDFGKSVPSAAVSASALAGSAATVKASHGPNPTQPAAQPKSIARRRSRHPGGV